MIAFRWICPSAWWPLLIGITKDLTARVGEKKLRSQRNSFIKCWRQNVSMNKIPLCSSLTTIFSYLLFSSSFEKLDNYNLRKHSVKSPFFQNARTRGDPHTHSIQRVQQFHEGLYTCVVGNGINSKHRYLSISTPSINIATLSTRDWHFGFETFANFLRVSVLENAVSGNKVSVLVSVKILVSSFSAINI